jgi:membrane-associated phospholipid phosphatase
LNSSERTMVGRVQVIDVNSLWGNFRQSERLVFGFMAVALVASISFSLSLHEWMKVWGLNFVAGSMVLLLSLYGNQKQSILLATLRDWFPCVLIPLAYRESGLFYTPDPSHRLDSLFILWDRALLQNPGVARGLTLFSGYLQPLLEFSYLLCYPLVPLGLLSLILARQHGYLKSSDSAGTDRTIDRFWTAVLLAVFTCYAIYPFFPLTPPRVLFHDLSGLETTSALRKLNLWLLHQNGDQASLFPSGHVAAVTASGLAVRAALRRLGWVFVFAAGMVAVATVVGRYHYAADAAAEALVGLTAFLISKRICRA